MRVLISGYYGFGNLGDEAILAALLQEMAARYPEWTPVVLSHRPSATEMAYEVAACARDSLLSLWEETGRADLLISGGGGLLQNVTSQLSLAYYLGILELARRRGTPYVILGQGLGPLRGPGVGPMVRRYLEKAEAVVLRDPDSMRLAQSLGVSGVEVTQAADLALLLQPSPPAVADNLLRALKLDPAEPVCGLILRGWSGREPWEAAAETCDYLQEHLGLRCLLLPFQPEDRALAWRVSSTAMTAPPVLEAPVTPADMLSLFGRLALVVTMRLHGLIFAAMHGVPALGLSYDPKVTAFAMQAEQKVLPLESLTTLTLRVAAEDLWRSREQAAPARAAATPRLRRAAETNMRVLGEVIGKLG
jgi:polysaccharide pyruvyl transferase CsaB